MIQVEGTYVVPRGSGDGDPIILDIKAVVKAEQRLQEVAFVNAAKAPELLSFYNENWLILHRVCTQLAYERNVADEVAKTAYAEALLDVTEDALKKRGHSKASQDLREAMATLDIKVRKAHERLNEIKAVLEYLIGKRQSFQNAYDSVKKLVGERHLPDGPLHAPSPQLRASSVRFEAPPPVEESNDDDLPGFVAPKGHTI